MFHVRKCSELEPCTLLAEEEEDVTQNSTRRRQNTLYFITFELIPMYTLVSEVHVCIKVTLISQLSSKPG